MHHPSSRPAKSTSVLAAAALASIVLLAFGPLAASNGSELVQRATVGPARAARTISFSESGRLHLTSKHGFTLNEQGPATGSVTGTIYVHLRIASTSSVTAEVSIVTHGGSVSGNATANYHRGNATANFSGSLSISRGTGSYAHDRGSGLSFSGTIQRSNDAIAVHMSGKVSE